MIDIPAPEIHQSKKSLFVDSTKLLSDPVALRARGAEDGYLFFKQRLPKKNLLALRAEMLAVVDRYGWRQKDQDELGGLIDLDAINQVTEEKMRTDIGVSTAAYEDIQRLEAFHRLPHLPQIVSIMRILFGKEVLVHPRHIARMITGHASVFPTPPHQDFPLIQGTSNTWTCWIPVGDCPRELGGLTILKASHRQGYLPIQPSKGAGGIAVPLCPGEVNWVEGDFETGDILMFPCYTIHKALHCQRKDAIRLSLDVRYQPIDEIVEAKSLLPHCNLTWEQIYEGWPTQKQDALKYYWQSPTLQLSPWEDGFLQPKRRIC